MQRIIVPCLVLLYLAAGGLSRAATTQASSRPAPNVVFISAEDEYSSAETLPAFARMLTDRFGWRTACLTGDPHTGIPGLDALQHADAAVLFVRRRALPPEQMDQIRRYLYAGKPLVALRTSCHAFEVNGKVDSGFVQWPDFGRQVLGANYHGHVGRGHPTEISVASAAAGHAILAGVAPGNWTSSSWLYKVSPIDPQATVLLNGKSQAANEPVAWVRQHGRSRLFFTSLGNADDFRQPQFQRLLLNALCWTMDRPAPQVTEQEKGVVGRPVRIVSVAIAGVGVERMVKYIEPEAAKGADLIVLPEVWPGIDKTCGPNDPPLAAMAQIAKKYHTYIVSPVGRREKGRITNSSVLIDRQGKVTGIYNKVYPVMPEPDGNGGEPAGGAEGKPGDDALVFQTDFGRVGMAICFDGQFPEVWQRLEDHGAQLVLFSSMYSAGRALGAYAMLHHYYVVSCCNGGECQVYDMTGDRLLVEHKSISRTVLDMDRRMVHLNDANNHIGSHNGRIAKMLAENPGVELEKVMQPEDWEVLKAVRPGVDLPAIMEKYGIRDLRTYLAGQRQKAEALRGGPMKRTSQ